MFANFRSTSDEFFIEHHNVPVCRFQFKGSWNSFDFQETTSNYPPYNLIQLNNHESTLEIALAGFKENELQVYTEFGKLYVQGTKEESKVDGSFVHKGLAQRSFKRVWTISDDTKVGSVKFEDGLLTVQLNKIVPEHHARKEYL